MASVKSSKDELHLFPVFIMIVWLMIVAATIGVNEWVVISGPFSKQQWPYLTFAEERIWIHTRLPGFLLTIFTQGHVPATAFYLSRLALSFVRSSSPTQEEIYSLADKDWQNLPLAIYQRFKRKTSFSPTYWLFTATCTVALATPILLSHAYQLQFDYIYQNVTIQPHIISLAAMPMIDAYSQLSTGAGSWSTGQSVLTMFNSSTFLPINATTTIAQADQDSLFITGNIGNAKARLPGVLVQRGCYIFEDHLSLPPNDSYTRFNDLCDQTQLTSTIQDRSVFTSSRATASASTMSCSPFGSSGWASWAANVAPFNVPALLWISANATYPDAADTQTPVASTVLTQGILQCHSNITVGNAYIDGQNGTFEGFENLPLNDNTVGSVTPLVHPLWGMLYIAAGGSMESTCDTTQNLIQSSAWFTSMGYTSHLVVNTNGSSNIDFQQPSLSDFATHVSYGIAHMANAVALLSMVTNDTYVAMSPIPAVSYNRYPRFAFGVFGLLSTWLCLLAYLTVATFNKTIGIGDTLDSQNTADIVNVKWSKEEVASPPTLSKQEGGQPMSKQPEDDKITSKQEGGESESDHTPGSAFDCRSTSDKSTQTDFAPSNPANTTPGVESAPIIQNTRSGSDVV